MLIVPVPAHLFAQSNNYFSVSYELGEEAHIFEKLYAYHTFSASSLLH